MHQIPQRYVNVTLKMQKWLQNWMRSQSFVKTKFTIKASKQIILQAPKVGFTSHTSHSQWTTSYNTTLQFCTRLQLTPIVWGRGMLPRAPTGAYPGSWTIIFNFFLFKFSGRGQLPSTINIVTFYPLTRANMKITMMSISLPLIFFFFVTFILVL